MGHTLGHKTSVNKFKKKIKNISDIFSNRDSIKLETNNKRTAGKVKTTWKSNNIS